MVDAEKKIPTTGENNKRPTPHLSEDFYKKLIRQPACKTDGMCDNCGRCEH